MALTSSALGAVFSSTLGTRDLAPLGKNTITSLSAAVGLGSGGTLPGTAKIAIVTVENQQVRYWTDGSTPTSSQGHLANPGDVIFFENALEVANAKLIEVSASATVQITFRG